jgi:hypothetical protein
MAECLELLPWPWDEKADTWASSSLSHALANFKDDPYCIAQAMVSHRGELAAADTSRPPTHWPTHADRGIAGGCQWHACASSSQHFFSCTKHQHHRTHCAASHPERVGRSDGDKILSGNRHFSAALAGLPAELLLSGLFVLGFLC